MVTHGGNRTELARQAGVAVEQLLDLSANVNPLGPPPWFRQELEAGISDLVHYPDPACVDLLAACAASWGVPAATLIAGNGSSELLAVVPTAWELPSGAAAGAVLWRVCQRLRGIADRPSPTGRSRRVSL